MTGDSAIYCGLDAPNKIFLAHYIWITLNKKVWLGYALFGEKGSRSLKRVATGFPPKRHSPTNVPTNFIFSGWPLRRVRKSGEAFLVFPRGIRVDPFTEAIKPVSCAEYLPIDNP